jgi:hypothetical protein
MIPKNERGELQCGLFIHHRQRTSAGNIGGEQPGRLSLGKPLGVVFF